MPINLYYTNEAARRQTQPPQSRQSVISYNLEKHFPGILNVLLNLDQKLNSLSAVQEPVVIGQRQVHHWPDLHLPVDSDRALLDRMQTQNGRLGQVDDGCSHQRTKDTAVADGKGTTGHVLDGELAIARLFEGLANAGKGRATTKVKPFCPCRQ